MAYRSALRSRLARAHGLRRDRGIGLLEITLGLGIIIVVIAAAVALFSGADNKSKMATALTQIQSVTGDVRQFFSGQGGYGGLSNSLVTQASLAPPNMITGDGDLVNPWGGSVTIAEISARNTFSITVNAVPAEACVRLANATGFGTGGGPAAITVNGTALTASNSSSSNLLSICDQGNNNIIEFEMR